MSRCGRERGCNSDFSRGFTFLQSTFFTLLHLFLSNKVRIVTLLGVRHTNTHKHKDANAHTHASTHYKHDNSPTHRQTHTRQHSHTQTLISRTNISLVHQECNFSHTHIIRSLQAWHEHSDFLYSSLCLVVFRLCCPADQLNVFNHLLPRG